MRKEEIRTVGKLCSVLHCREEYIFDLINRIDSCYYSFNKKIRKKDGIVKIRRIDSPNYELRKIQRKINNNIIRPYVEQLPKYVHGGRLKKSIVTNASSHVGSPAILYLDIKDCFPSIPAKRVYYVFKNFIHCSDKVASILTKFTTKDGILPQGCATSAGLCNLVLAPTLEKMSKIGGSLEYNMSHYIDDVFYSGKYADLKKISKKAMEEIGNSGFRPNNKKTRICKNGYQMKVTGVTVNVKVSAGRKRIRKIQREILTLTQKDKVEYYRILKERKKNKNAKIKACKIEKILGEISNVISINEEQGYKLKNKIEARLKNLTCNST